MPRLRSIAWIFAAEVSLVVASKMTFPLAMNVATLETPSDSKTWRKDCILMVRPRPTLALSPDATLIIRQLLPFASLVVRR
jgi:hypothetical protein